MRSLHPYPSLINPQRSNLTVGLPFLNLLRALIIFLAPNTMLASLSVLSSGNQPRKMAHQGLTPSANFSFLRHLLSAAES